MLNNFTITNKIRQSFSVGGQTEEWTKNMTTIKFQEQTQVENLQMKVTNDIKAVIATKRLFGGSCFSSDSEKKISALHGLNRILAFHFTPEELNTYFSSHNDELINGYVNNFSKSGHSH